MKQFIVEYDREVRLNCVATITALDEFEAFKKFQDGEYESDEIEASELDRDTVTINDVKESK